MRKSKWNIHTEKKRRLVKEIGDRDGYRCHYCGALLSPPPEQTPIKPITRDGKTHEEWLAESFEMKVPNLPYAGLDHRTPRQRGGTDNADNLVLCCMPCNSQKGSRYTHDEFLALKQST